MFPFWSWEMTCLEVSYASSIENYDFSNREWNLITPKLTAEVVSQPSIIIF